MNLNDDRPYMSHHLFNQDAPTLILDDYPLDMSIHDAPTLILDPEPLLNSQVPDHVPDIQVPALPNVRTIAPYPKAIAPSR